MYRLFSSLYTLALICSDENKVFMSDMPCERLELQSEVTIVACDGQNHLRELKL